MSRRTRGFSLIELLVVIGIIALLMAVLMPVLAQARQQAKTVVCQSNMRSIGQLLLIYANNNRGWVYPVGVGDPTLPAGPNNLRRLGSFLPPDERWPAYVKGLERWDHPLLICPLDQDPADKISYVLNYWLSAQGIRFHGGNLGGATPSEFVVMGEKREQANWYFFADSTEYADGADPYKHGSRRKFGANYLFLDTHVAAHRPKEVKWGFAVP